MQKNMNYAEAGSPKKSFYAWQEKVILVVEDEDHNYTYIYEILKRTRISMIRAITGKDAIRLFKENKIDLVLMDIKLPDIDGLNVTMEIKRLNPQVPVIAQTAYAMAVERERCLQAGCDDYLSKPYDPDKLLNIVQKYLL